MKCCGDLLIVIVIRRTKIRSSILIMVKFGRWQWFLLDENHLLKVPLYNLNHCRRLLLQNSILYRVSKIYLLLSICNMFIRRKKGFIFYSMRVYLLNFVYNNFQVLQYLYGQVVPHVFFVFSVLYHMFYVYCRLDYTT